MAVDQVVTVLLSCLLAVLGIIGFMIKSIYNATRGDLDRVKQEVSDLKSSIPKEYVTKSELLELKKDLTGDIHGLAKRVESRLDRICTKKEE